MKLNVKHKTIKLLEKNRIKSLGSKARQRFLRLDAECSIYKRKKLINKLNFVKIKKNKLLLCETSLLKDERTCYKLGENIC